MKYVLIPLIVMTAACGSTNVKEVNQITGTYVMQKDILGSNPNNNKTTTDKKFDTVVISRDNERYKIFRSGVIISPGEREPRTFSDNAYFADYSAEKSTLIGGRLDIHFIDGGKALYRGSEQKDKYLRID